MTQLKIEGTIDLGYEDTDRIDAEIFRSAARILMERFSIERMTHEAVRDRIDAILGDIITERVNALLDKNIPQIDRFGDPTGDPKPFRDLFADRAEAYLTETVDSHGRAAKPGSFGGAQPRLAWLLREVGAREFEAEARKVAKEVKDGLQKSARAAVAKVASESFVVK